MGNHRKLTDSRETELIERYVNGDVLSALGTDYGISPATVRNILIRHDVERRSRGAEKQYTDAELAERARQARQRWYQDQKQKGLCVHCSTGIALPGSTSCQACTETARLAEKRRTEAGYGQQWYEGKKQQGLCVCCGVTPVIPSHAYCESCAEKQRQKSKSLREKRKASGRCITCGGPTETGTSTCLTCRQNVRGWYEERKQQGLCLSCDNPAVPGKTCCVRCLEQGSLEQQERYRELKQQGLCTNCGAPAVPGRVWCKDCAAKDNARKQKKIEQALLGGLCVRCHRAEASTARGRCTTCYLKSVSYRHFGTNADWQELQELFDRQKGCCALSKVPLKMGYDAELDHIVPRSRGGSSDLTNVQWVHAGINRLKDRMAELELGQVVQALYNAMRCDMQE